MWGSRTGNSWKCSLSCSFSCGTQCLFQGNSLHSHPLGTFLAPLCYRQLDTRNPMMQIQGSLLGKWGGALLFPLGKLKGSFKTEKVQPVSVHTQTPKEFWSVNPNHPGRNRKMRWELISENTGTCTRSVIIKHSQWCNTPICCNDSSLKTPNQTQKLFLLTSLRCWGNSCLRQSGFSPTESQYLTFLT